MNGRNFCFSAPQVFCLLLFYLLSGMMLFSGSSFFSALFISLFSACLCVIACAVAERNGSALSLFRSAFGSLGFPLRLCAAFFSALPLARTLAAFSADASSLQGGASALSFAPVAVIFCVFGVAGGFSRAARFSEVCVFALAAALLLALFGGGGGINFAFPESALFSGFDAIGAPAVFFTLYLRCATPESGKMSDSARNSAFHPSPLASGLCAAFASLAVYAYFCFAGNNILFSLISWFFALVRLLLFALAMADLLAYPEKKEGAKCALLSCAFCAFWVIFLSLFPDAAQKTQVFAAVILPCAIFICSVFARDRKLHSPAEQA